jgi:hypothetical protein
MFIHAFYDPQPLANKGRGLKPATTVTLPSPMHVLPFLLLLLPPQGPTAPAGTRVEAKLQSSINSSGSKVGDEVIAVLVKPIPAHFQGIPQGSRLLGRVETISPATESSQGRVRIVFREIEFPDGRRTPTWITDSFTASQPKRILRYFLYTGVGGAAGALIGGSRLRVAASLGGALTGFILAMNRGDAKLPDLTMRPGQILHLRLGEDLVL